MTKKLFCVQNFSLFFSYYSIIAWFCSPFLAHFLLCHKVAHLNFQTQFIEWIEHERSPVEMTKGRRRQSGTHTHKKREGGESGRQRDQGGDIVNEWKTEKNNNNNGKTTNPCIHVTRARQFRKWLQIRAYLFSNVYSHTSREIFKKHIDTHTAVNFTHANTRIHKTNANDGGVAAAATSTTKTNGSSNNKEIVSLDFSPFSVIVVVCLFLQFGWLIVLQEVIVFELSNCFSRLSSSRNGSVFFFFSRLLVEIEGLTYHDPKKRTGAARHSIKLYNLCMSRTGICVWCVGSLARFIHLLAPPPTRTRGLGVLGSFFVLWNNEIRTKRRIQFIMPTRSLARFSFSANQIFICDIVLGYLILRWGKKCMHMRSISSPLFRSPKNIYLFCSFKSPNDIFNKKAKQRKKYNIKKCSETIEMLLFIRTNSTNYSSQNFCCQSVSIFLSYSYLLISYWFDPFSCGSSHAHTYTDTDSERGWLNEFVTILNIKMLYCLGCFRLLLLWPLLLLLLSTSFLFCCFFYSFSFFGLIVWFALSIFNIKVKEHEQQQHDEHTLSHTQNKLSLSRSLYGFLLLRFWLVRQVFEIKNYS